MKVTKHIALKMALVFAFAGFASYSSDEGQMEEPVQGEARGQAFDLRGLVDSRLHPQAHHGK